MSIKSHPGICGSVVLSFHNIPWESMEGMENDTFFFCQNILQEDTAWETEV